MYLIFNFLSKYSVPPRKMSLCDSPQKRGRESYRPVSVMPSARRSFSNTSRASIGSVGRRSLGGNSSVERRPLHQPRRVAEKYVSAKDKADQRAREQLIKARKNRRMEGLSRDKRRVTQPATYSELAAPIEQQQQQPQAPTAPTPAEAPKPFSLLSITYSNLIESMGRFIKAPVEEPVPESRETRLATLRDRRKREKMQPVVEEQPPPESEFDLNDLPCDEDFAPPAALPRKSLQDRRLERQRQKAKASEATSPPGSDQVYLLP